MERKKILTLFLPAVIVAGLLLAFGALAFNVWNPLWNPFNKNSAKIEEAIIKTSKHKTLKNRMDIKLEAKGELNGQDVSVPIELKLASKVDKSNKDFPKTSSTLGFSFNFQGLALSGESEIIGSKNAIYFRITKLPFLFSGSVKQNKWYKVSLGDKKGNDKENEEAAKKIISLFRGEKIFKVRKNYGKEKINGYTATHYLVEINEKTIQRLVPKIIDILYSDIKEKGNDKVSKADIDNFKKEFNKEFPKAWKEIKPLNLDFWINDKGVVSFHLSKELDIDKLYNKNSTTAGSNSEVKKLKIEIKTDYYDFDKKVNIKIPENAKEMDISKF